MIDATTRLEQFLNRTSEPFAGSVEELIRSIVSGRGYDSALSTLAERLKHVLTLANLNGRRILWMEVNEAASSARFGFVEAVTDTLAFLEAVADLVKREPRLAPSAELVAKLYSTEKVFAMAESVSVVVTKNVQRVIAESMESGEPSRDAEAVIASMGSWTRSYAENVYQTNVSNAFSEGRIEQAKDPAVKEATPAFRFVAMDDERVRPNHWAANGFIAGVDDPIWRQMRPPLGYRCRCGLNLLSRQDLEERNLITKRGEVVRSYPANWADARPDEGFRPGAW